MKTLLSIATIAATLLASSPAAASSIYADAALLATIEGIEVVVSDQVRDGCLFNASGIKARLSAMLERSGIAVFEAATWKVNVIFYGWPTTADGRRIRAGCMMTDQFELRRHGPSNTWIVAAESGGLTIGPDALDSNAMQSAERFADEVIAAILAARRSVGASASGRQS
jgi:hypothetical protein